MENKEDFQPDDIKFEKRKFKRINGTYIVSYAPIKGEDLKFDVSQTRNLSEGGLLFISDRKFEKDIVLKIKLRLPEFSDYVIVKARVVDSIQLAKGIMNETRVMFVDIDKNVREAIRRLADHG
jgi:PilZ domain